MTRSRLRILHVVPSLARRIGGPAFAVVGESLVARAAGFDITVYTTNLGGPPAWQRRESLSDTDLPPRAGEIDIHTVPVSFPSRFAYSRQLREDLEAVVSDVELVRIHSLWLYPQYIAGDIARRHGVPYVVSLHGALDPWLRRHGRGRKWLTRVAWQDRMLKGAAAIHVTTALEAQLTSDTAVKTPRFIAPLGIWFDEFQNLPDAMQCKEDLLGPEGATKVVISSIGRLARKKALDRLLEAFALLPTLVRRDSHVVIAGPDDEGQKAKLQRSVKDLDIESSVTFLEMINPTERRRVLAATDIWVLPSHTENFAIAALEALAAGCAVVVSPGVMIATEIEQRNAGVIVANTPVVLAKAIHKLIIDEALRTQLGLRGAMLAREYDWKSVGRYYCEMYAFGIGGSQAQGAPTCVSEKVVDYEVHERASCVRTPTGDTD